MVTRPCCEGCFRSVRTGQALVQEPDFVEVRKFVWRALHQFSCMHSQHPACGIFLFDRKWAVLGDKVGDKHRLHKTGLLYNLPSNPQSVRLKSWCLCAFSDTNLLSLLFFIIPKEFVLLLNFNNLIVHHNRCRDFSYNLLDFVFFRKDDLHQFTKNTDYRTISGIISTATESSLNVIMQRLSEGFGLHWCIKQIILGRGRSPRGFHLERYSVCWKNCCLLSHVVNSLLRNPSATKSDDM